MITELTKGLFKENPIFVIVLGLCPALAVSTQVVNAIGMGAGVIFVLLGSNIFVSLLKNFIPAQVRIPAYIVIIASFVTIVDLVMQAYAPSLSANLGVFVQLIVVNCVILGRADGFARKNSLAPALYDGLIMGVGFAVVLVLLGALRELAGTGALFADMDLLFGPGAADWKVVVVHDYENFLLAILPPGAFIFTGLIIALKNIIDARIQARRDALKERPVKGSKRVRVTGTIS